jgi:hypothetical protein
MDYKQKLTPSLASQISKTKTDKHYEVTDTVISGFKLKRYVSGTMTFSLMYTASDGRRLRYTMGQYPALSVPAARKLAEHSTLKQSWVKTSSARNKPPVK